MKFAEYLLQVITLCQFFSSEKSYFSELRETPLNVISGIWIPIRFHRKSDILLAEIFEINIPMKKHSSYKKISRNNN